MSLPVRRFFFGLRYFLSRPPWDTGVSPPELLDFLDASPPGRALDLGCGTGTNVSTLAQHGWTVVGVDFVPKAVRKGKRKVREAGVEAELRVGDVTQPLYLGLPFDLILDIADETFDCIIHDPPAFSLAGDLYSREFYADLYRVLKPGGKLFHYIGNPESKSGANVTRGALNRLGEVGFSNLRREPSAFGILARKK